MHSSSTSTLDSAVPRKTTSIKSLPSLQPIQTQLSNPHLQQNASQRQRQESLSGVPQQQSYIMHKQSHGEFERERGSTISSMNVPIQSVERSQSHQQLHQLHQSHQQQQQSHQQQTKERPGLVIDTARLQSEQLRIRSATLPNRPTLRSSSPSFASTESNAESPTWLLSDLLSNLSSLKDKDEYSIVQKSNDLVSLFQNYPNLKEEVQIRTVLPRIQFMLCHPVPEVRSSCYRILRHLIVNYDSLILLGQSKLLIFIITSLANDQYKSSLIEMTQALKLIRQYLTINKGADLLSVGVIKALVAIVEGDSHDHNHTLSAYGLRIAPIPEGFKNACLETICEVALLKPELVFHSGGFKLMITSIIEGSFEVASTCLMIVLRLLSFQNSRKFVRNGFDLDSLIAVFSTDENTGESKFKHVSNFKLQKVAFLISLLLRDFNGLIAFSINNFTSIKNLLINLSKKNHRVQDLILDIILDALRIKVFPWLENSTIGDFIAKFNHQYQQQNLGTKRKFTFEYNDIKEPFPRDIIHHYQGLLTYILVRNGLLEKLLSIIEEPQEDGDKSLQKKAGYLLSRLYFISNSYLPSELIMTKLQIPGISEHITLANSEKTSAVETNQFIKSQVKSITAQANSDVDDDVFKTMIANSKVLTIKEFEQWNWPLLTSLVQGPLTDSKRFEEVLEKSPKFFKRLVSFYRPFKYRFSSVHNNRNASRYIEFGCLLFEMFLSTDAGLKYFASSKMLPQIAEIVAQIDPYSGISSKDPILSKKRLENTASMGYLRFIGVLSGSTDGLNFLTSWQLFTMFTNIISASSQTETTNLFILTLFRYADYTVDNTPFRILLKMSLTTSNLKIRISLLKHVIPRLLNTLECQEFCIGVLIDNLYDVNHDIVICSIDLLFNHCQGNNFRNLQSIIKYQPIVHILQKYEIGRRFLVHFLNDRHGFQYLESQGYLEHEFNKWFQITEFEYSKKLEQLIRVQFYPYVSMGAFEHRGGKTNLDIGDVELSSLYFFKCLLSTEEGLSYFQHGVAQNFFDQILSSVENIFNQINNGDEFLDVDNQDEIHCDMLNLLKQNLWIIGQIGSGKYGIQLLDPLYNINLESSIVELILDQFHNCPIWEIRGVCFYVLGMVSTTVEGVEILDEYGWSSVLDQYGNSMKFAYPRPAPDGDVEFKLGGASGGESKDDANLFNVAIVNPYRDAQYFNIFNSMIEETSIESQSPPLTRTVFHCLHNLNSILSKIEIKAIRELHKLKLSSSSIFEDGDLFLDVIRLIDKGNFAFHKRVFIFKLFIENTRVLETILKRERRGSFKVANGNNYSNYVS
ncbi:hypothetical protein KGF57_004545 [Candida theae]|uniref:Uncharacterized protein n=1 Tax=Candida theae TaxID=1198502 RepID=A0AAD5BAT7_9ASCO|nr:uncharacterized protein KGF57_004545 [Candida theae]KAI5949722.1 hypothetical protein KGF57_004545 [Candida theae]